MPAMRPELETLPIRMRSLPLDARGYPVPWFVAWVDGAPEFRAMDPSKWLLAVRDRRCWVCGGALGVYLTFVIGPMCGVNRTTSEPACHLDCAQWSARNCPFLSRPHAVRREDSATEPLKVERAGVPIDRNPGVTLLWTTRQFYMFNDGKNKPLIRLGDPTGTQFYANGRLATRAEVEASVESGLPLLLDAAAQQRGAEAELLKMKAAFEVFYPAA